MLDTLCLSGEVRWAQCGTGVMFGGGQALMPVPVSDRAQRVLDILRSKGPSFARDLDAEALDELTRATLITCDGFLGRGGRWSLLEPHETTVEQQAWTLLRRYGVVTRRLLGREDVAPWRELARVYRTLEARGEIRGGRFVTGMSGEQFALPAAVERLREVRRSGRDDRFITISAADPLNLTGIIAGEERIRASAANRI